MATPTYFAYLNPVWQGIIDEGGNILRFGIRFSQPVFIVKHPESNECNKNKPLCDNWTIPHPQLREGMMYNVEAT